MKRLKNLKDWLNMFTVTAQYYIAELLRRAINFTVQCHCLSVIDQSINQISGFDSSRSQSSLSRGDEGDDSHIAQLSKSDVVLTFQIEVSSPIARHLKLRWGLPPPHFSVRILTINSHIAQLSKSDIVLTFQIEVSSPVAHF
jgi:hypothetical protein